MNRLFQHIFKFLTLTVFLVVAGCAKTSIDQIPSYLAIDTISLKVTSIQGTASQKISDAWVYANNDLIGAFELPAKFPLLKSGTTQISIFAGIKLNGINETRVPYPFYAPYNKDITLERENVDSLGHLTFSYLEGTKFAWQEDFEQINLSIDMTARSEVSLVSTQLPELSTEFPNEMNDYAAKVVIPSDSLTFECVSHDMFKLPTDGSSVFLELNYKSNNSFTAGIFVNGSVTSQKPILVINPSTTWNKIYINLTPTVSANAGASGFSVFFAARKSAGVPKAEIYFDNIKLLHF
jgi:hypothetical protein